jgi:hypothetical protein
MNFITMPAFMIGVITGMNERTKKISEPPPDYRKEVLGLTSFLAYPKSVIVAGGFMGGAVMSSCLYGMGYMLARSPSKDIFE